MSISFYEKKITTLS